MLTAAIAFVSASDAMAVGSDDRAGGGIDVPATRPLAPRGTDGAAPDSNGSDDRSCDLGTQPVLLFDRAAKPLPRLSFVVIGLLPAHVSWQDCQHKSPLLDQDHVDSGRWMWPSRHTGVSLMPHGPPSFRTAR